ncbi:hypothetical protein A3A68_01800 [Candidatus Saccharibacteria bacterium RIFCSPLOWO2_01_FULL_48_13]|nr:MAG: hypothetical protein A2884_02290 [Candidatus Saccharibacteria bacterium RIFCSPHIGHO2_01_FULL_48_12]OGL36643.1 MAG: hypothetical protein A3F38_00445 [Candidatus Saccharibacteria bacterium RIFCSPHIGHO2_12_FULL_48_21]OGL36883.1 MAG: hypothetical protein A3A68_01800 [Candidatus Saccharibacteria bacterium RIFCSPLOWO2_01_FULL_48_13]
MKLFYAYTSPKKEFTEEAARLIKLQIDNNLELGWSPDDILLYANFEYQYRDIKSHIVPDIYTEFDSSSNKVPVILYLLQNNLLDDHLYWYHDLDVYQLDRFEPPPVKSFGVARYAYKHDWQCGSFFFRNNTEKFFDVWNEEIKDCVKWSEYTKTRTDEKALKSLVIRKLLSVEELNHTYNFCSKFHNRTYPSADQPVRAAHFRPASDDLDVFMYGNNRTGKPYLPERLIDLFHRHGYGKQGEISGNVLTFGAMIQFNNEMPENLPRAVASARKLCKYVVGYDDASTDGSGEWGDANLDVCLHGKTTDWMGQINHKIAMLAELKKLNVDWIFWLDADEELSPTALAAIPRVIEAHPELTGIYIPQVNLWSDRQHYRVDRKFGRSKFLRLWKNRPELMYHEVTRGLHQEQFPPAANENTTTLKRPDEPIIHYSWDSPQKIRAKHARYAAMGQTGEDLNRIAEDPNAELIPVKPEWFWSGP